MSDVTKIVDTYLAMWNETDPARRAEYIDRAWARDGYYVDPQLEAEGRAALNDMVTTVQARFPGHRFRRISGIDKSSRRASLCLGARGPRRLDSGGRHRRRRARC